MRIRSKQEIVGLGQHAREQINKALSDVKKQAPPAGPKSTSVQKKKRKKRPSRIITDPTTGFRFCPYPSTDPGVWLHKALNKKYGSFENNGHHAHEVIIPGHEKKFRWDHIIYGMLCIELDGYGFHFDLKSFKRDREKQKHALVNGFIVHRVTAENIKTNLEGILNDIDDMLSHHHKYKIDLSKVGNTQYKLEDRTRLESD